MGLKNTELTEVCPKNRNNAKVSITSKWAQQKKTHYSENRTNPGLAVLHTSQLTSHDNGIVLLHIFHSDTFISTSISTVGPRITPPHIALFHYCTIFKWFQSVSHSTIFIIYSSHCNINFMKI